MARSFEEVAAKLGYDINNGFVYAPDNQTFCPIDDIKALIDSGNHLLIMSSFEGLAKGWTVASNSELRDGLLRFINWSMGEEEKMPYSSENFTHADLITLDAIVDNYPIEAGEIVKVAEAFGKLANLGIYLKSFLGEGDLVDNLLKVKIRASLNWREVKALETVESGTRIHAMKGVRTPGYTEPEVIARLVKLGLLKESDKVGYYELLP